MDTDAFGWWLAGLTDGEGCFAAYRTRPITVTMVYKLTFRDDDSALVDWIHNRLGVGRVLHDVCNGSSSHPQSTFAVTDVPSLHDVIVPLFEQYPLKSRKREDFAIFRTIVDMQYKTYHKRKSPEYKQKLDQLILRLKEVKRYERVV